MGTPQVNASALVEWRGILANTRLSALESKHWDALGGGDPKPKSMSLRRFVQILERIGKTSAERNLSWDVGARGDYANRGKVGKAVMGAKTLGAGLQRLVENYPLIQDATLLRLDVEEEWASLSYKILDPDIWPRHEDALYSLGLYSGLIKIAAPEVWSDVEVILEAEKDMVRADLAKIVKAPVSYGGSANILRFPTVALNARLRIVSAPSADLLKDIKSDLVKNKRAKSIPDQARELIFGEICEGDVSQEKIARELGLSSRTLRRKLSAENLSFQGLLDECRMRVAALEFRTRDVVSLSDLALKLGYSEHSTFSRAFSRWAGMAPQEYRRSVAVH